jgi:DNA polymerase-3 subunit gamma/tau
MLVSSLGDDARAILRGISPEQFELLAIQANRFGLSQLTQAAEATNRALNDTFGSSNPRLQLELLCARVLAPAIASAGGSAQPSVAATTSAPSAPSAKAAAPQPAAKAPASEPAKPAASAPAAAAEVAPPAEPAAPAAMPAAVKAASAANIKGDWQDLLEALAKVSRSAWAVAFTTKVLDYQDEVLTLLFQSQKDVDAFKNAAGASEVLRQLIFDTYGVRVKYKARVADATVTEPISKVAPEPVAPEPVAKVVPEPAEPEVAEATDVVESKVVESNMSEEAVAEEAVAEEAVVEAPAPDEEYGEFVLRDVLGATPIETKDK